MTDLAKTIAPKSDQLNADDLIAGPMTITISGVRGCDDPDQPIAISFEGDNRKPYKPCKSMRRVMVHCWGADGNTYAGRRMTLFCDPNVLFGGIKVGGIRISHMSHIDREKVMALTASKAKRTPYTVKPLDAEVRRANPPPQRPAAQEPRDDEPGGGDEMTRAYDGGAFASGADGDDGETAFDPVAWATEINRGLDDYATLADLNAFTDDPANIERFQALEAAKPAMAKALAAAITGRRKALASLGR